MKKARLDMNDLLEEARIKGYFDLSQIQFGILEANGEMSFLPYAEYQPMTPKIMNQKVSKNCLTGNVVIDGVIMKNNLEKLGKSKEWLEKQLHDKGIKNKKEILLATLDQTDKLIIYRDNEDVIPLDILE